MANYCTGLRDHIGTYADFDNNLPSMFYKQYRDLPFFILIVSFLVGISIFFSLSKFIFVILHDSHMKGRFELFARGRNLHAIIHIHFQMINENEFLNSFHFLLTFSCVVYLTVSVCNQFLMTLRDWKCFLC